MEQIGVFHEPGMERFMNDRLSRETSTGPGEAEEGVPALGHGLTEPHPLTFLL